MLRQVFQFYINSIHNFFNLLSSFTFDTGITLYSVALFIIFARITIFMISYVKSVMHVAEEHDVKDFQFNKRADYYESKRRGRR